MEKSRRSFKKKDYVEHHLAHASSAYRNSGIDHTLVLTVDGVGDDISSTVNIAKSGVLQRIFETRGKDSIGLLYQSVTEALGFVPIEGEYKTMGLASYGDKNALWDKFHNFVSCLGMRFRSAQIWESEFQFPYPSIRQHQIFKDWLQTHKPEDLAAVRCWKKTPKSTLVVLIRMRIL